MYSKKASWEPLINEGRQKANTVFMLGNTIDHFDLRGEVLNAH